MGDRSRRIRTLFFADYYETTRARLDSLLAATEAVSGPLEVGFGRASITPAMDDTHSNGEPVFTAVPLAGYSDRKGQPAEGVHDSLFVRAVALRVGDRVAYLVSWDGLIFPLEVVDLVLADLQTDLGVKRDAILFSASHTHCGLGGWGEGFLAEQFAGPYSPELRKWLAAQAATAVRRAHADLTPATFGYMAFHAPDFVRNRLVGDRGWVDDEFQCVVFRQNDGDYGLLGIFAAHATVLSAQTMLMSGDYPGYWQRAIEAHIPGMAVFFAGGVGSHRPAGPGSGFEKAQTIGESLADSVLVHFPRVRLQRMATLAYLGLPVALPERHVRITDGLRLNPALARHLVPYDDSYLQVIQLGPILWAGTPCDFSGELAMDIKNLMFRKGYQAIITSFNGSYVGYLIPGKYYHYDSYESRLMSFYGPYMGDYFDELLRRMMLELARLSAVGAPRAREKSE